MLKVKAMGSNPAYLLKSFLLYDLNPPTQLIFTNRFVGNALFFINCNQAGFYHSSWIYSNLAFYWLVQIEIFIASETLWSNSQICKGRKKYMNFNLNKWLLFFIFSTCCLSTFWLGHFWLWFYGFMFLRKMNSLFSPISLIKKNSKE